MRWLEFLHVLSATVWLGAWAAICMFAVNIVRQPDAAAMRRFYAVMRSLGPTLIGPATLVVLASGIVLVARSQRVAFGDLWIIIALVLYALVTAVGMVGLSGASRGVTKALDADDLPAAVVSARRWMWYALVVTALLLLTTWDMVFRP